ncbi:MAG: riboflavin synthase [Chloroherpetonaceae bacterium]|nr:riboflavin synthase [Chthonomonadaceae bacterium]MDW8208588.1 riboflavin synthase [Chloroherpetonaceae bacterium]
MFTGIVEEMGTVVANEREERSARLTLVAPTTHAGVRVGDSVAVNGCCLTVVQVKGDQLTFDAVPETLHRTNLGTLKPGDRVNLERALAVGARLGGHFVQGHIDGVGTLISLSPQENAVVMEFRVPPGLSKYIVEKGSIAVDGVSLTVAEARADTFTVWIIPHTREITTLGLRQIGDPVNLECDLLGKYVERLIEARFSQGMG